MTLPAVGASVWARGSQVWTGKRGTLTAKPARSARRIQYRSLIGERCPGVLDDGRDVEGAGVVAEIDGGGEREDGAGEGEEEEFSGGVAALGSAPDADDEEHRNECQFEEDVEDEEVAGDENAEHGRQEQEHPGVVFARPVLDAVETGGDGQGHEQGCKQNQPERNRVDAQGKTRRGKAARGWRLSKANWNPLTSK